MENIRHLCESIKSNCAKDSGVKAPQISTIMKPKPGTNTGITGFTRQNFQADGAKTPDKDGYFYMMWRL
uniref:CSON012618 protein n=1 Tax=Culicoides sonorensis TaxID=179676 RepID=A0A336KMS1_CULSO